ncbi:SDR family oxidoreductase [Nocardiopsis trehalosi]|uniref:SDR family oxidoreductase n=1 Tax=Nocardiopsis trehalosi TaxID=109329 RepID=UPI00082FD3FA|nr:SDR family oxidoreductase [Nocardiopsis trehalosi]
MTEHPYEHPHARRTAIVTGGSRGIGRAVARRLAADGLAVVVGYVGGEAAAADAVAEITADGGTAVAARADVGDEADVAALFDTAEEAFGGVDVVAHAAGVMVLSPVAEIDMDDLDRMHRTNIRGTFLVAREAARRVRNGGAVLTFSTTVTKTALPGYAGYAASKGAVEAIGLILARELRGRDITVNTVAPGPTATDLFLDGKDQATVNRLAGLNPMNRLGTPGDIAEVVSFLAGPGRWINGQTVYANGGMA